MDRYPDMTKFEYIADYEDESSSFTEQFKNIYEKYTQRMCRTLLNEAGQEDFPHISGQKRNLLRHFYA